MRGRGYKNEIRFYRSVKNEMKPALGVTEVGAIALAAARAYAAVGGKLQEIRMVMNGGMYKNAFSCAIPGTEELGCNMAAALGALGGDWTLGLEVLKNITAAHVAEAKTLQIPMDIKADETKEGIYILAEIRTSEGVGVCRIEDFHANIVFVAKNDTVLFQAEQTKAAEQQPPLILKQLPLRIWWIMQKPFPSQNCPV